MGIRDTSYYGWEEVLKLKSDSNRKVDASQIRGVFESPDGRLYAVGNINPAGEYSVWVVLRSYDGNDWEYVDWYETPDDGICAAYDCAIDLSGTIYVVGQELAVGNASNWLVRRSTTGNSGSFVTVDGFDRSGGWDVPWSVVVDSSGSVYVGGQESSTGDASIDWVIRKSTTGMSGTFGYIDHISTTSTLDRVYDMSVDSEDSVYAVGSDDSNFSVRKSLTGLSGSFVTFDTLDRDGGNDIAYGITIDSNDKVYVGGSEQIAGSSDWIVRASATGESASFSYIDSLDGSAGATDRAQGLATDSNNSVYVVGYSTHISEGSNWIVRRSHDGTSGSFTTINESDTNSGADVASEITIVSDDTMYISGFMTPNIVLGVVRRGRLTSNSSSLGPKMLATSIGYVDKEPVKGDLNEKFKLNNISEFPHSSGIYQMRNVVLGTTDSGFVGNTEDAIVRVQYFGSVVSVMWPKQKDQDSPIFSPGDAAAGQRAGKLTTVSTPGDFIDVREFDHMTLYCYLIKGASGSLDNIDIQVERRPLTATPFSVDQTIEYSSSGSNTIATMKDLVYRKSIDYGDLTIKEIGYPIDIPLSNVREIRVSCRQVTGQDEEKNKNFLVWGRFIDSEEET